MTDTDFAQSVISGLSQPQKNLEPKFFYDERGSALFDQITNLEAYYPTRTEISILRRIAPEIAAIIGPGAVIVEPGAGSALKVGILLEALDNPAAFAPGDISIAHLAAAAAPLAMRFPSLPIRPFALDFDNPFDLPSDIVALGPVTVFFPGSTIGNFSPSAAEALLKRFAGLADAKYLLIGVDLKKDIARLIHAYDDPEGVTAAFNMNILARANRELGANFDLTAFRHRARYDEALGRIEMHLESLVAQTVSISDRTFTFAAGETIHTENSHKYTIPEFQVIAAKSGWTPLNSWTDSEALFSVHLLEVSS